MKNPRLKLTQTGWQCYGEVGHYKIAEYGPTLAIAYIKYQTAMRDLIKKDPINAFHQPRKQTANRAEARGWGSDG